MAVTADQQCVADIYGGQGIPKSNDDMMWLLLGSFLVFYMQAGFALLEAGQVRRKNRKNMLLKNVMDACLGGVVWYLCGYAFAYGKSAGGFIGVSWDALGGCGDWADWIFQWTFAATASTIISGAIAERTQFLSYLCLIILVQGFVYPVAAHWVWNADGWLGEHGIGGNGLMDFAGSGVVHITGGASALAGASIIGPRTGRYSPDSVFNIRGTSIAFTTLGTMTLWFSWYGFNCVSTGSFSLMYSSTRVAVTTTLGACAGGIGGLLVTLIHSGAPDILPSLNGILGGLVSITAGAVYMEPYLALVTGLIGGALQYYASWLLEYVKVDDVVDASPVHLFCGIWGLLAVGLFASPSYVPTESEYYGVVYGGNPLQLGIQVLGAAVLCLWATVLTGAGFKVLAKLRLLRVSYEEEIEGLDKQLRDDEGASEITQQFQPSTFQAQHARNNLQATDI